MRKTVDMTALRQRLLDAGCPNAAEYAAILERRATAGRVLEEAGSNSITGPELRVGLAQIQEQMEAQFGIHAAFFYMGHAELRNKNHPEIVTRPGLTVLEWLSLASKLTNVPRSALEQLDVFCAHLLRNEKRSDELLVRMRKALRQGYISLRRKLGMDIPDRILLENSWF